MEGRAREGRVERRVEEEEDLLVHSFHINVLLRKLRQTVRWDTEREGGEVSSPGGRLQKPWVTGCGFPPGETP